MTISAQHVRAALNHLRGLHPAWRRILKSVGPFTVRIERRPAWWLTQHLHCRSFWDFAALRRDAVGSMDSSDRDLWLASDGHWSERQRNFWTDLQTAQEKADLELKVPASLPELENARGRLSELLERYQSTIFDRFCFYCWGELDSWPTSDPQLLELIEKSSLATSSEATNAFAATVGSWAPYRSVAAWYLERWGESQRSEPCIKFE
ncbi:MAG: hypothetical protein JNK57_16760 [Planctomycetaceae bacterium]|nr:hypothetical protein [Planctomycetaceae bacterium]